MALWHYGIMALGYTVAFAVTTAGVGFFAVTLSVPKLSGFQMSCILYMTTEKSSDVTGAGDPRNSPANYSFSIPVTKSSGCLDANDRVSMITGGHPHRLLRNAIMIFEIYRQKTFRFRSLALVRSDGLLVPITCTVLNSLSGGFS